MASAVAAPDAAQAVRASELSGANALSHRTFAKHILTHGTGDTMPKHGDTVMIHYEAFVGASKTPFDSTFAVMRPYLFEVGMHQAMCGLEDAVCSMTVGEVAMVTMHSSCVYDPKHTPKQVKQGATINMRIKLLRIRQSPCIIL